MKMCIRLVINKNLITGSYFLFILYMI